jgi:hypothetical protein
MSVSSARPSNLISTVDELASALGDTFVIFCGSAISGILAPQVPMVYDMEEELLWRMARELERGSKTDRLISRYTLDLAQKEGRHRRLLNRTKFEMFVWRLKRILGKDKVDELLSILYACQSEEYGPNHAAIGFLLDKRKCLTCLTTNFDNSIELSLSGLIVIDKGVKPSPIPDKSLFKLHGDALSKTCTATSPELTEGKLRNDYHYLQALLSGKKILVLGYSGVGDIDIAPHLRSVDAQHDQYATD